MTKLPFISRYITCFQIFHINTDKFIDLRNPTYLPVMWRTVAQLVSLNSGKRRFSSTLVRAFLTKNSILSKKQAISSVKIESSYKKFIIFAKK